MSLKSGLYCKYYILAAHSINYVTDCYESQCVQKFMYHRFLVYNPKDYYYPFKVETFKLPSSCDCLNGRYHYKRDYGYKKKKKTHPVPHHSYKNPSTLYYNDHEKLTHQYEHQEKKVHHEAGKKDKKVPLYVDETLG